jgi:hypothetical protein
VPGTPPAAPSGRQRIGVVAQLEYQAASDRENVVEKNHPVAAIIGGSGNGVEVNDESQTQMPPVKA